jgi:inhibitor-of-growth protein 1
MTTGMDTGNAAELLSPSDATGTRGVGSSGTTSGGTGTGGSGSNERKKGGNTGKKKKRKARQSQQQHVQQQQQQQQQQRDESPPHEDELAIDPDEPTYCLCDQISYGEMILCDNDLCPIEWFHFSCVALATKPKGKWYCPKCRGDRPNVMKPKAQFLKELERYNKEKEEKS